MMKTQELDTVFGVHWDFEMILFIAAFLIFWPGNISMKERQIEQRKVREKKMWTYIIVCKFFVLMRKSCFRLHS